MDVDEEMTAEGKIIADLSVEIIYSKMVLLKYGIDHKGL